MKAKLPGTSDEERIPKAGTFSKRWRGKFEDSERNDNRYQALAERNQRSFALAPAVQAAKSPLDVPGVSLGLSAEEIVSVLRGVRARDET